MGDGQSINGIVFSVGADKLHKRDLPAEVECGDQPVASASNFKAGTWTIYACPPGQHDDLDISRFSERGD